MAFDDPRSDPGQGFQAMPEHEVRVNLLRAAGLIRALAQIGVSSTHPMKHSVLSHASMFLASILPKGHPQYKPLPETKR